MQKHENIVLHWGDLWPRLFHHFNRCLGLLWCEHSWSPRDSLKYLRFSSVTLFTQKMFLCTLKGSFFTRQPSHKEWKESLTRNNQADLFKYTGVVDKCTRGRGLKKVKKKRENRRKTMWLHRIHGGWRSGCYRQRSKMRVWNCLIHAHLAVQQTNK